MYQPTAYESVRTSVTNYLDQLPKNWALESVKSCAIAFAVSTVLNGDPVRGLIAGSLSATASLIHSGITPLFKTSIGENRKTLTWNEEMLRACVSYAVAGSIGYMLGCTSVMTSLFFQAFLRGIIIVNNNHTRSLDHANWLVLFP